MRSIWIRGERAGASFSKVIFRREAGVTAGDSKDRQPLRRNPSYLWVLANERDARPRLRPPQSEDYGSRLASASILFRSGLILFFKVPWAFSAISVNA